MTQLFALTRRLIDCPSLTPEEGDVGAMLEAELAGLGLTVETQHVSPTRKNLWLAPTQDPRVVLCTHMDTVPPFIPSSEDDEYIYGRGACDAKGIIAAMILAVKSLREANCGVGLLLVVGEETDSLGAKTATASGLRSDFVIVGEPTGNKLATGHKGILGFRLTASGIPAHSAYPDQGVSAVHRLLDVLHEVRSASWGESKILGSATVNVGKINGGIAPNVFAPSAEAVIFVRVVGTYEEARRILDGIVAGREGIEVDVVNRSSAVQCHLVAGFETVPVSFGSDIPSLSAFGKPLMLGPGSIHDAHTAGEKILKSELVEAVDHYQRIVKALYDEWE